MNDLKTKISTLDPSELRLGLTPDDQFEAQRLREVDPRREPALYAIFNGSRSAAHLVKAITPYVAACTGPVSAAVAAYEVEDISFHVGGGELLENERAALMDARFGVAGAGGVEAVEAAIATLLVAMLKRCAT